MASLSTVYFIGIILASVAGMSSAFLGNKLYPIKGGMEPVKEESVKEESVKEESVKEESVKEESVKEESVKEEPIKEEPIKEEPIKEEPNPFKDQDTSQLGGADSDSSSSSDSDSDSDVGGYRKHLRTARRNRYLRR
jgi:hypothetical protein